MTEVPTPVIAPKRLGSVDLWSARIVLPLKAHAPRPFTPADSQDLVTHMARQTRSSIVGYHSQRPRTNVVDLTLLHWPETRPSFQAPTVEDCNLVYGALVRKLDRNAQQRALHVIERGSIHTILGLRVDGYRHLNRIASLDEIDPDHAPGFNVSLGIMVSARFIESDSLEDDCGRVESYSEPVGVINAHPRYEQQIHHAADRLRQHHYAIAHNHADERRTDLFETRWAETAEVDK